MTPTATDRAILRDVAAGLGIDDIRIRQGVSYLAIWDALRRGRPEGCPWVRLAARRAEGALTATAKTGSSRPEVVA